MSNIRITIRGIRYGQPRAYADSTTEEEIFLEHIPWNKAEFEPWELKSIDGKPWSADNVPSILQQYIPGLRVPPKSKQKYGLEPYLSSFYAKKDYPGYYVYAVISPFTD